MVAGGIAGPAVDEMHIDDECALIGVVPRDVEAEREISCKLIL